MFNLNEVKLGGNLTAAPELKTTSNGTEVLSFAVAINRKNKDNIVTTYVDCIAWRNVAKAMANNLGKGATVYISGHLDVQKWEKDGQKHSKTVVVADSVQFIATKKDKTAASAEDTQSEAPVPADAQYEEVGIDDELPF